MKRVVVDTDILVDHLHEIEEAKLVIERARRREIIAYISAITELELLSGKECKNLEKRRGVEELIGSFTKVKVSNEVAQKAGEFRRNYGTAPLDSIVAATAFCEKAVIWTRNIKDYKRIKEVKVEKPY